MNLTDKINNFAAKWNLTDDARLELQRLTFDSILIGKQWNTTITNTNDGSKPANHLKRGQSLKENGLKKKPEASGKINIIN